MTLDREGYHPAPAVQLPTYQITDKTKHCTHHNQSKILAIAGAII
jgi:hypothetical protein